MHALMTIETAAVIAAKFGLDVHPDDLAKDVEAVNKYANIPQAPSDHAEYRKFFTKSLRTGLRDPAENLTYWYEQQATSIKADDREAAATQSRLF